MHIIEFTAANGHQGRKLVRVICQEHPQLKPAFVFRALRHKDIQINGKRVSQDQVIAAGDIIRIYGTTSARFEQTGSDEIKYQVIFQDKHLLVVDKKPGISVHADPSLQAGEKSLLDQVREDMHSPSLQLCHRLDRQTGGLLVLALSDEAALAVRELMDKNMLVKRYHCLVRGVPAAGVPVKTHNGVFFECKAWLEKKSAEQTVYIHDQQQKNDRSIITRYRVLRVFETAGPDLESVSELEVELVSGRTHQIRAHMAYLGHPLLGDGKYGRNQYNRHFSGQSGPLRRQQLYATSLTFDQNVKGLLADLAGQTFSVKAEYDWRRSGPQQ